MSERIRLTIAVVVTSLLLLAVTIAGIALHTGQPAPAAGAPISLVTHSAHPTATTKAYEEQD